MLLTAEKDALLVHGQGEHHLQRGCLQRSGAAGLALLTAGSLSPAGHEAHDDNIYG